MLHALRLLDSNVSLSATELAARQDFALINDQMLEQLERPDLWRDIQQNNNQRLGGPSFWVMGIAR